MQDLVLIPGWNHTQNIWQSIEQSLQKNFQLHHVTFKAFNSLKKIANAIAEQVPADAIWLGSSFGGLVAMHAAANSAIKIKKLIISNSTPCFIEKQSWPGLSTQSFEHFIRFFQQNQPQALRQFHYLQSFPSKKIFAQLNHAQQLSHGNLTTLRLMQRADMRKRLKNIHCPSLFIFGEHDQIVSVKTAHWLNQFSPNCQTKILATGHLPFVSHPHLFCQTILDFTHDV